MMPTPLFSVLIVNYNSGEYLQNCLDSLNRQTLQDFEILLVDNNSTDDSFKAVTETDYAQLILLPQPENHGFAKANNIAAQSARGTWLALLNPDAIAEPNWLETLHKAIQRHSEVRVFASTQYCLEDPSKLDGVGDAYLAFGFPWRGGFLHPSSTLPEEGLCFSPCGASALYHRKTFLEFGGFDERFFCYCEDVDLGFRMQLDGLRCMYIPGAAIHHAGSAISGSDSYFTAYHGNRNRIWTYLKNMPLLLLLLTLPGHLFILGYIYLRNRKQFKHSGMRDGIRDGFRSGWKLRRTSKGQRRPVAYTHLLKSFAWNPFRMSKSMPHILAHRPERLPSQKTSRG